MGKYWPCYPWLHMQWNCPQISNLKSLWHSDATYTIYQGSHGSPAMKFPDFFLTKCQFLLTFCSPKIYLTFEGINVHHTNAKELLQWSFRKRCIICHFYVPYQLNYSFIYKMSKYYKYTFPNFLTFLAGICGTGQTNHDIIGQSKFGMRDSYWYQLHFSWHFPDF